jgi:glycosyltransferase involved in cell wall biosynthesis
MSESIENNIERPLVTFALFAYNQEKYIREAVEGALAQTYEPLEIILSDDCSTDRTFEVMEEMVASYTGPHMVLLNKNHINLGIGGHVNKIDQLAKGDLILHAAGDDISLAHRTTATVSAWLSFAQPSAVWSNAVHIDENGVNLNKLHYENQRKSFVIKGENKQCDALGASLAVSRKVIEIFGSFNSEIFTEDSVIIYRSLILDGIQYINEPLVLYRQSDSVSKKKFSKLSSFLEFHACWARCGITLASQKKKDYAKIGKKYISLNPLKTLWFNEARLEIVSGSLLLALVKILRVFLISITAARQLTWLLLVRLGIKKNFAD